MFPVNETVIFLGIAQSAFLTGDSLGAPIGTMILDEFGINYLLITYALLSLLSGITYYFLFNKFSNYYSSKKHST